MLQIHTAEQVRAADAAQIAVLPEGELMQRAARGLAEVLREELETIVADRAGASA